MESSSNKVYSVQGKDMNSSNSYCTQRPDLVTPRKLTKMTGCLEIIVGEDFGQIKSSQDSRCNSQSPDTSSRPGSGSFGSASSRADSSLSRRVITPSKQITLQAVRRKEDSAVTFADQVDWQSFGSASNNIKNWELGKTEAGIEPPKTLQHKEIFHLEPVDGTSQQDRQPSQLKPTEMKLQSETLSDSNSMKISQEIEVINNNDKNSSDDDDEEDDSDDEDGSDSSEEEEEKLKAPNELLMEFVDCLMRKDFQTSSKLCKMILLYEPENKEALKFQPLIEEKVALDAEAEKEAADEDNDSDDYDDDDDGSEDDDDSDSNEDSSDDDDDSSSDNDDGNNDEGSVSNNINIKKKPSGPRSCQR